MKGRLKRTLKEVCPKCKKHLQLRTLSISSMRKGLEVSIAEERIFCSSDKCDYTEEVEQKRVRLKDEL